MSRMSGRAVIPRPLSTATALFRVALRRLVRVGVRHLGVMLGVLVSALMLAAVSASAGEHGAGGEEGVKRPYRLDDWLDAEEFRVVAFSPDGQAVAFTRRRAKSSQVLNVLEIPETRDDIWLQTALGKEAKNLTKGVADASGGWNPQWSKDGEYLSFLSSRGGNVTVWVWERRTDSVRQVSQAGIEFRGPSGGCRWLAGPKLLCLAVLERERSTPTREAGQAVEYASAMWAKVRRGELAVSPVDSLTFKLASRRLVLLDLGGAAPREIGNVLLEPFDESWWLSPDEKTVAFIRDEAVSYPLRYRSRMDYPASLELRSLDGRALTITGDIPSNVLMYTLRWAPDGRSLAFFALGKSKINPVLLYGEDLAKDVEHEPVGSLEYPAKFWQIDLRQGNVAEINTGDIDLGREARAPSFQWLSTGEWLFRATRLSDRAQPHRQSKAEWWVLGKDAKVRKLLHESAVPLERIETFDGGRTFLSLYERDVWSLDVATGVTRNLTETFAPPVIRYRVSGTARDAQLIVKAGEPVDALGKYWARYKPDNLTEGVSDYVLDPRSGSVTPISAPEPGVALAAFHGPTRSSIYELDDNRGTRLWRGTGLRGASDWARLAEANAYYQRVASYQERLLEYTTLDGQTMLAKVTLPIDYVAGRKYPVVVDSDIGYVPESSRQMYSLGRELPPSRYQTEKIFASAGYVYMFTSAPTRNILDDAGRANLLLLTHGILPALDAAIAAGFADPDRFVLYGVSSFGYGALAVVTQTARFKAAVAQSSWSDQVAAPLLLNANERYSDNPFDATSSRAPYSPSDLPFWRNGDHLRRNSPLSYVDRVQTPLMIIQHEFDFFPMSHAEMFFSALVVQRKPARFLRYFGEQHGLEIPANARDSYRRVFAWFDDYCDIERDQSGRIVFDGARAKSRNGRPALTPGDFTRFGPAADGSAHQTAQPNN